MVHDLQIRAPYLKREEGAVAKKCSNVPTGFTLSVLTMPKKIGKKVGKKF